MDKYTANKNNSKRYHYFHIQDFLPQQKTLFGGRILQQRTNTYLFSHIHLFFFISPKVNPDF